MYKDSRALPANAQQLPHKDRGLDAAGLRVAPRESITSVYRATRNALTY